MGRLSKALWLVGVLCGLCASVPANTTSAEASGSAPVAEPNRAPLTRISLLLPLRSENFGLAAQAVRDGFLAAYERDRRDVTVTVIETGDLTQDVLTGYRDVVATSDIVVGPLSRNAVTAIALSGAVNKPTIALTQPETAGDVDVVLPPKMLVMGLSIEEEARQIAGWASADASVTRAFVIYTATSWQRRAARAFALQWQRLGLESQLIEVVNAGGTLGGNGLAQLRRRIQAEKPAMLFAALDAAQGRQLRSAIGNEVPLYGTSQLNPFAVPDWASAERAPEMDGAYLIDIPWELQPGHPVVTLYPRPLVAADQRRSADLDRLYALGIDAFRVAREIALKHTSFELDGVTGKLKISFEKDLARFQRIEQPATYLDGVVTPMSGSR